MAIGSVKIKVRPLRIAFLVRPTDKKGLMQAIEMSTAMWGGAYCPIIPAFGKVPYAWERDRYRKLPKSEEIISGYLDAYDPDIVVTVGVCEGRAFEVGYRDIVTPEDLLGDLVKDGSPRYGFGFIDVLQRFINDELRFERKFSLDLFLPDIENPYKLFMASVLGKLPESYVPIVRR
jgi:hypothetical protein